MIALSNSEKFKTPEIDRVKDRMFEISKKTRSELPIGSSLLKKTKEMVVGKKYDLSLVLIENNLSKKLNKKFRGKNRPTNVLSFSLSKNSGEIFLNLPLIKKQAVSCDLSQKKFLLYLFIHGLLHLKGLEHGKKMDRQEKILASKLKISIPQ